jgi:hypothetical protein
MKIASGATVLKVNSPSIYYFETNLDASGGNSGSLVANANTWNIEATPSFDIQHLF